ncbi:ATP-binding protein [Streptomyces sp. A7024]|uniref:ATP-binding protein n=1 Tax=Streptomyces coryli TaxID=1128680 RepID=A0A6G4UCW4_9ACTN|nr:ATP-binding protein [Streptomyces coryli]
MHQGITDGRFPIHHPGASLPWRGAEEVSGVVTHLVAQQVPASSTMAVTHGPAGVGDARRRMRNELLAAGAPESAVDDAVLILSELLSNACRHARPLADGGVENVRADWSLDERGCITVSVTDGGGPTRPLPAKPSVTARGGRGLAIIRRLSRDWGVSYAVGEVTVWAVVGPSVPASREFAGMDELL